MTRLQASDSVEPVFESYRPSSEHTLRPVMSVTLCMVVRDEADRLAECLSSALPMVDEVLIADTGSTDGTPELIRRYCNVEPFFRSLDPTVAYSVTPVRNWLYEQVRTEWILYLDADEILGSTSALASRTAIAAPGKVRGFFGRWTTSLPGCEEIDDYKLFLFRRDLRKRGLAHANIQADIRLSGRGEAAWLDGLYVHHRPTLDRLPTKRQLYRERLIFSIASEPRWLRYHWFLGYMYYQDGLYREALATLAPLLDGLPPLFPVEALNARVVAIDILARQGDAGAAHNAAVAALALFELVRDDFEVAVNFRLEPWLVAAKAAARDGRLHDVVAYTFAC